MVRLGLILDREFKLFMKRAAVVAQLLEHKGTNLEIEGSNLLCSRRKSGVLVNFLSNECRGATKLALSQML